MLSMCAASCVRVGSNVQGENIRPFARMNSVPVWIVNTYTNMQDANKAKAAAVFSPTVQTTLKSTRDDMMNAGTALIKALSSQQSTTAEERKDIEQQLRSVETKMSKLVSQSQNLDISLTDAVTVTTNINKNKDKTSLKDKQKQQQQQQQQDANAGATRSATTTSTSTTVTKETFLATSSLGAQEKDTRIQFESNYTFYTVFLVIAIVLFVIMFSNFFYTPSESSDSSAESGSYGLMFGIIVMLFFIYFIVQYILVRYNMSRPQLPFESVNPLFVL